MNSVVLENDFLQVIVNPQVGGTITSIIHRSLNMSILGTVPWTPVKTSGTSFGAPDENTWLSQYTGGWPILFPNGGDACDFDSVFHGFHGEASIAPWEYNFDGFTLRLERQFYTVPMKMSRELSVSGELLTIKERLTMNGSTPIKIMWGHHPTFGTDLLDGAFEIQTGAKKIISDDDYDHEVNPLHPGASGHWPFIQGKDGTYDMSQPKGRMTAMSYLTEFEDPWMSIRRIDNSIGMVLSWDSEVFPCAWLWCELNATMEQPWFGRARLIGLEPNTSWPATGLANIAQREGALLELQPGETVTSEMQLNVFKPTGPITGVECDGYAVLSK